MIRYYVDLRPLPLSERASAVRRMEGFVFLVSEEYESSVLVGANVFWDSDEPIPPDVLPDGCPYRLY